MSRRYDAHGSVLDHSATGMSAAPVPRDPLHPARTAGPAHAAPEETRWRLTWLGVPPLGLAAALAPVDPDLVFGFGLWLAGLALLGNGRLPRLGPLDHLALLLCGWVTASLMWTRDAAASQVAVQAWWTVALLLVAARHVLTTRRRLLVVAGALLAGTVWTAVRIVLAGGTGEPAPRVGLDDMGVNHTSYALTSGTLVCVMLLVARVGNRPVRAGLWTLFPLFVHATVLTGTSASLIALAAVAGYLLVTLAHRHAWAWSVVLSALLLVAVPFGHLTPYRPEWLDSVFNGPLDDLSGRLLVWPIAEASFWESPLVGIGAGAFPGINPYFGIGAHSLLLTLGNDVGLVGIAIFIAMITYVIRGAEPTSARRSALLVGVLVVGWTPIWLTGHWEISPLAWMVLALWSRLPVALAPPPSGRRRRRRSAPPQLRRPTARGADGARSPAHLRVRPYEARRMW
ncbi:O-antigen ligase family protein [Micromonospora sp. NPDC048170]|uniref:O-antigen ligase family protein n=1 Tax=Micromonospora sp. NPDC048170 TaxID=3154819 RepID=UPI0033E84E43